MSINPAHKSHHGITANIDGQETENWGSGMKWGFRWKPIKVCRVEIKVLSLLKLGYKNAESDNGLL